MLSILNNSLLRSGALVGFLRVAALLFALAISIVAARFMGPEAYGTYSLITTITSVLALLLHGGMPTFLIRETARLVSDGRFALLAGLRRRVRQWVVLGSMVLFLGLWIFRELYDGEGDSLPGYLYFAFPLLPLIAFNSTQVAFLKGLKLPVASQIPQNLIQPAAQLAFMIGFVVWWDLTVRTAVLSLIGSTAFAVLAGSYILKGKTDRFGTAVHEYLTATWIRSLAPFTFIAVVTLLSSQVTTLIMGALATPSEVAYLRVADRVSQLIAFSLTIVNVVVAPHFAERAKEKDWSGLERIARSSVRLAFAVSLPLAIGMILFGKPVVGMLFGPEYANPVWSALAILSIGQLISVFFGSVANVLNMSGHEASTIHGMLSGLATNAALGFWLVPKYGAMGGAIAMTACFLVWNGFMAYRVLKILGVKTTPV